MGTANYDLPLFTDSPTSKPTWLGDWNTAMTTIDATLKTVEVAGSANQSQIYAINTALNSAKTALSQLTDEVNTLTTEVDNLTSSGEVTSADVEKIKTDLIAQNSLVKQLSTTVSELDGVVDGLQSNVNDLISTVTTHTSGLNHLDTEIDNLKTKTNTLEVEVDSLDSRVESLENGQGGSFTPIVKDLTNPSANSFTLDLSTLVAGGVNEGTIIFECYGRENQVYSFLGGNTFTFTAIYNHRKVLRSYSVETDNGVVSMESGFIEVNHSTLNITLPEDYPTERVRITILKK